MNVGISMGEQYRKARMAAAQYNEKLATLAGAAEALDISAPETIGRWERDEVIPSNHNIRRMAELYHAPELMNNYCALSCPVGRGRFMAAPLRPVEQLAIRMRNVCTDIDSSVQDLLLIAEDGIIDDTEKPTFDNIITSLSKVAQTISQLQLTAEKLKRSGEAERG